MNIAVQLCGLIITIVLLVFYSSARRVDLYKRRIFFYILLVTLTNIFLDISSIIAIYLRDVLPELLVLTVCRAYVCMLIVEAWSALVYTMADVFPKKKHMMFLLYTGILTLVECLTVFLNPVHIYANGLDVYTYGTGITLVYLYAAVDICAIWIVSFVFSNVIKTRRKYAVRLWMIIWLTGMAVQAMHHSFLVVGFATSLGIMVVYFMLENPESFIDKQYNCLNSLALAEYTEECRFNGESFSVCDISLENAQRLKGNNLRTEAMISEFIAFFEQFKNIYTFKNLDKNILLVSKTEADMNRATDSFVDAYMKDGRAVMDYRILRLENGNRYSSIEEIMRIINYMKLKRTEDNEVVTVITEKVVEEYEKTDKIKSEIARALDEDRVEVFLQPIYNTGRKRFTSAEALVRIRNTDGSLMPPGQFIPVAEMTGQINELGKRVLEKTCDFMSTSEAISLGIEYIEVNLSVVQAEKMNLFEDIMETIRKYRVEPNRINLEITESALIQSKDTVIDNMNKLRDVGITFALDDFGKGESNLMYLVEMPFDILKLDMDMTKAFHVNDKAKSAVRTVRFMADDMKLKIVAEGIENQSELDAFMEFDIDYIQGYHFSKPLPMTEFIEFIREYNKRNKIAG